MFISSVRENYFTTRCNTLRHAKMHVGIKLACILCVVAFTRKFHLFDRVQKKTRVKIVFISFVS